VPDAEVEKVGESGDRDVVNVGVAVCHQPQDAISAAGVTRPHTAPCSLYRYNHAALNLLTNKNLPEKLGFTSVCLTTNSNCYLELVLETSDSARRRCAQTNNLLLHKSQ
jgi:hypothetical protein